MNKTSSSNLRPCLAPNPKSNSSIQTSIQNPSIQPALSNRLLVDDVSNTPSIQNPGSNPPSSNLFDDDDTLTNPTFDNALSTTPALYLFESFHFTYDPTVSDNSNGNPESSDNSEPAYNEPVDTPISTEFHHQNPFRQSRLRRL